MKPYTLLRVCLTLTNIENRKKFSLAIRKYMNEVKQPQLILTEYVSPYTIEVQHSGRGPKILLVMHQFSRTGTPYAVLYLARALLAIHGERPVVISPQDGPLRKEFEQEGFVTLVDPLLFNYSHYSAEVCDFVADFDQVIATSISSYGFIRFFRGISKRMTWWIHEVEASITLVASKVDLPLLFATCESIWLGSPLCFSPVLQYAPEDKLHQLCYGCPDTALPHYPHASGKTVFAMVGTIERRKGQDVFLEAIERLPEALRNKALFRIIGSLHISDNGSGVAYYNAICDKAALIPEVERYENMPFEELQEFYAETDVFVSASRYDPMPIVITQGLMNSRVCLCSSVIGQVQLLEEGKSGLMFNNESVEELSAQMAWVLENPDKLDAIGIAGRAIFEKHFDMSNFVTNVQNLLGEKSINCSS